MSIVPRYEYLVLLFGDVYSFGLALWVTLFIRNLEVPHWSYYLQHLAPFSILFIAWLLVFFVAGLYGKQTRIMRRRLPGLIFTVQTVNVVAAALFFFALPSWGIAPKTILAIYLLVSSIIIFIWRVNLFPLLRPRERHGAILIGTGDDVVSLVEEINSDERYPFRFTTVLDTQSIEVHQVVQHMLRVMDDPTVSVIVADASAPVLTHAFPLIYDSAFRKKRFAFIELSELYMDVFDRVPLTMVQYDWVLTHLAKPPAYDHMKRFIDILASTIGGLLTLPLYPIIALLIKMDDAGPIFISQERVGRFFEPIHILKFRTMSGGDSDAGSEVLKSKRVVTRVGRWLRKTHLDELPQFWNVFKGDLSLVGPRPELPALAAQYSSKIPYYNARHLVSPGLTGWARIRHENDPHHGEDVYETKNKLAHDLYYLKHRSLTLDIFIMFQTLAVIVGAKGGT